MTSLRFDRYTKASNLHGLIEGAGVSHSCALRKKKIAASIAGPAGWCFAVGFGALLLMPVIGYQYLQHVRYSEPQAFHTLMLGARSWLFDLVALLYGLITVLGSGTCFAPSVRAAGPTAPTA